MVSAQHEALFSIGRPQRRRITELSRQNNALRSQVARQNETLSAVSPALSYSEAIAGSIGGAASYYALSIACGLKTTVS
jgi:hypothetical protein